MYRPNQAGPGPAKASELGPPKRRREAGTPGRMKVNTPARDEITGHTILG